MQLLVATTNENKIREIEPLLANLPIQLITLAGHVDLRRPLRKNEALVSQ